ncbi:hypothetical protein QAD02_008001 [Eretmocerus hayati]|uniref:Uncharacterized protein n=1 Tax=Eretmocerus hayati TaxID=131215 RepID=A0ACC2N5B3_9HYME|nr:hypothetical protein QAD02_008001 [Eretmocerus hayati]
MIESYPLQGDSRPDNIHAAASTVHPFLVIKGESIYKGSFYVVIEETHLIKCDSFLDGILMTFLAYYIYGYNYKKGINKTLELIQRLFLRINPQNQPMKKDCKSRSPLYKVTSSVRKLPTKLSTFSNIFRIECNVENEVSEQSNSDSNSDDEA